VKLSSDDQHGRRHAATTMSTAKQELPLSVDDISPGLLERVLAQTCPGLRVKGAEITSITHGTATRLYMDAIYEDGAVAAPPGKLFIKTSLETRHDGYDLAHMGLFGSEVRFYQELAPRLPVPTPQVFGALLADDDGRFMLIMEDLRAKGLSWLVPGATLDVAAAGRVLDRLAALHAASWNNRAIDRPWLQSSLAGGLADLYRATVTVENTAQKLTLPRAELLPSELRDPRRLTEAFWDLRRHSDNGPQCLVHGDLHLQNLAFAESGAPVFTDWQVVRRSTCSHDLAFFMGSALSVEDRRLHEDALIERYREGLAARNVPAEDLTHITDDYQMSFVHGLLNWLRNPDSMQPAAVNNANLERFAAAVTDHDSVRRIAAIP
jgi:aminoglycoside phosphotransferase (APT) family kinase protein